MFGFFIKKNFFDGWDNCLYLLVPNVIMTLFISTVAFVFYLVFKIERAWAVLAAAAVFILAAGLLTALAGSCAKNSRSIADFGTPTFRDFFCEIPNALKKYFGFGCLCAAIAVCGFIGIPFYLGLENHLGIALAFMLAFFIVIMILALQWFIPLSIIFEGDFKKTFKKCFIILFDNTGFSVAVFLYSVIIFALSCPLFLLLPGLSAVLLGQINALRLRLYKYDWLEMHPDLKNAKARKNIPWDALLNEDRHKLGRRTFRSLFNAFKGNDD